MSVIDSNGKGTLASVSGLQTKAGFTFRSAWGAAQLGKTLLQTQKWAHLGGGDYDRLKKLDRMVVGGAVLQNVVLLETLTKPTQSLSANHLLVKRNRCIQASVLLNKVMRSNKNRDDGVSH